MVAQSKVLLVVLLVVPIVAQPPMIALAGIDVLTRVTLGARTEPVGATVRVPPTVWLKLGIVPAAPKVRAAVWPDPGMTVTYVAPGPSASVPVVCAVEVVLLPRRLMNPPLLVIVVPEPMRLLLFASVLSRFSVVPAPSVMPLVLAIDPLAPLKVSVPVKTEVAPV